MPPAPSCGPGSASGPQGVALELEQKFPLRELGEERLEAVRVAQGSELPAGDFIREREIVPAEHVHMLVQRRPCAASPRAA